MKKLRIIHADRFVREQYDIQQGEEYQVISEGQGEKKYGYTVNSKGATQAFKSVLFRPLDEVLSEISIEELTHQLVEKC